MERELWTMLSRAIDDVSRHFHDTAYHQHTTGRIVRVYLWAVLHDRPVRWACHPQHWHPASRPTHLPNQSTMSRRTRTERFDRFLHKLGRRLAGRFQPVLWLLKLIDGKPLPVPAHSTDPEATWGRGVGGLQKGYKLHAVYDGTPMPVAWEVQPLGVSETGVAQRLIPQLPGTGYLVGDANYDDSTLFALARRASHRLVAPRRKPKTGLAKRRHDTDRLKSIALLEAGPWAGQWFGWSLMKLRKRIETSFGHMVSFFAGLKHLPPWVRRTQRVRPYVHAKLLINAARIRRILA